jgi:hypothetical protein
MARRYSHSGQVWIVSATAGSACMFERAQFDPTWSDPNPKGRALVVSAKWLGQVS